MQPFGGALNAVAIFNAQIARSRFIRLLITARQGLRSMPESGPVEDTPGMKVQDQSSIQPNFTRPDVGNVTCPLLVGASCYKGPIQQVLRDVELVITFGRHRVSECSDNRCAVLTHQASHTTVTDTQADLLAIQSSVGVRSCTCCGAIVL